METEERVAEETLEQDPDYTLAMPVSMALSMLWARKISLPETYRPQVFRAPDAACGGCGESVWVLSHDHDGTGVDEYEPAFFLCHPCDSVRRRADIEGQARLRGWPGGPCAKVPALTVFVRHYLGDIRRDEQKAVEAVPHSTAAEQPRPPAAPRRVRKRGLAAGPEPLPECRRCKKPYSPDRGRKTWCRDCRQWQSDQFRLRREERQKARGARKGMEQKRRRANFDPDFAQRLYEGVVLLRAGDDGEMPYEPWPWGNGPAF